MMGRKAAAPVIFTNHHWVSFDHRLELGMPMKYNASLVLISSVSNAS
jgi:hypothetical protein